MAQRRANQRAVKISWRQPSEAPDNPGETTLRATLEGDAPRYLSPDGGFAIWHATRADAGSHRCVLKGALGRCAGGEVLEMTGRWIQHPQHGWSFQVASFKSGLPQTAEGMERWLARRIPDVGKATAQAIVSSLGSEQAFERIDANPQVLREVRLSSGRRLSDKQVEAIIGAWDELKQVRQIETFLFSHGITAGLADRLYYRYGGEVLDVLQQEPYRIIEVRGIGFRTADQIARRLGIPLDDPQRLQAGLVFVLEQGEDDGHTFLSLEQLLASAEQNLEVSDKQKLVEQAGVLSGSGRIVVEPDEHVRQRVYRRLTWERERRVAARVRWLLETNSKPLSRALRRPQLPQGMTPEQAREQGIFYPTDEQWAALEMAFSRGLSILTGLPGVGKTAVQKEIIDEAQRLGLQVLLAAPTGKAARRMTELTGEQARTIHRLLEWSPVVGDFQRNADNPLKADLVVVDEASMLSLELADSLIQAIGPGSHLLLVGDTDQLPPIGAGNVLHDLIESGRVPRTHLTRIFRQAAQSMIITNAHRINAGQTPFLDRDAAQQATGRQMANDFFWVQRETAEQTAQLAIEFATERIPRAAGALVGRPMDTLRDVMVIAPMHRGACGLELLNREMQARLNPDGQPLGLNGMRVGDRVIQTRNDYSIGEAGVMNGEIAIVERFDKEKGIATLSFDDGERSEQVPHTNLETFQLAYAISCHRAQGSQFPAVVAVVSTSHFTMLSRALIYTAVTRAESMVVLVGEKKALLMGLSARRSGQRNSTLGQRIRDPQLSGELF